jgi:hypothetical protein
MKKRIGNAKGMLVISGVFSGYKGIVFRSKFCKNKKTGTKAGSRMTDFNILFAY